MNRRVWAQGRYLRAYATQELRPVEAAIMARHRERLSGRVLEAGVGAGRIAGHLIQLAEEFHGIDLSEKMIRECRRRYPQGTFLEGDISNLSVFADGTLDVLWAGCNLLDIFNDAERRATLREIHRVLAPGGAVGDVLAQPCVPVPRAGTAVCAHQQRAPPNSRCGAGAAIAMAPLATRAV